MSEALVILYVLMAWGIVMTAVVLFLRVTGRGPTSRELELEELRARYARAEISREEYDRQRRELDGRLA